MVQVDGARLHSCALAGLSMTTADLHRSVIPTIRNEVRGLTMRVLLLLPFVGLLSVPFYNGLKPELFGFPFFYWYQLMWVPITSLLLWIAYRGKRT
jgi:hypothetical protein